jgi:maleylpyruvate isomerase
MANPDDRTALIARQGAGARYDAPEAPAEELLLARRATAYFARLLNNLPDDLLGDDRARVVASVGYHARGLAHLVAAARGVPDTPPGSLAPDPAAVTLGASLPPRALRGLFDHAAIHLDVEWRDLPGSGWDRALTLRDGGTVTPRATPRLRALALWRGALALDAGGRAADLPPSLRREAGLEG